MLDKNELKKFLKVRNWTLVSKPVKVEPLFCKIGLHNRQRWSARLGLTSDEVRICMKCGLVETGWSAVGLVSYYEQFRWEGYIKP